MISRIDPPPSDAWHFGAATTPIDGERQPRLDPSRQRWVAGNGGVRDNRYATMQWSKLGAALCSDGCTTTLCGQHAQTCDFVTSRTTELIMLSILMYGYMGLYNGTVVLILRVLSYGAVMRGDSALDSRFHGRCLPTPAFDTTNRTPSRQTVNYTTITGESSINS